MKIPTSSSIFLATLAISSSSTCLAAPAGDAPAGNSMSAPQNSTSYPDGGASDGHNQARSKEYINVEARDGPLVQTVQSIKGALEGLPGVGPIIGKILDTSGPISQQDISSLQSAADQLKGALGTVGSTVNGTAPAQAAPASGAIGTVGGTVEGAVGQAGSHLPGPAGAAAGALDAKDQNDGGPSGASASATPTASAAAADAPSGSATPSTTPSAPPNSPTLPVNV